MRPKGLRVRLQDSVMELAMRRHSSTSRAARRQRRRRKYEPLHYRPGGLPVDFELRRLTPTGLFPLVVGLGNLVRPNSVLTAASQ